MTDVVERFIGYTRFPAYTKLSPEMPHALVEELLALGLSDVREDANHYVYGVLPATPGYEDLPALGLFAHTDTACELPGGSVKPVLHPDYDGGDVELAGTTLRVSDFPHLGTLAGRTLITAGGTTLLGADDRAGVAEIVTMLETLIERRIPHVRIAVCFTSDEERGSDALEDVDTDALGISCAYTVDGGAEGELEYENFNAAAAVFSVRGLDVHPGSSKDTMINASLVAMEINALLPAAEVPRHTEDHEGFFHLCSMSGDVAHAQLEYIIRDHDAARFEGRLDTLHHIEKIENERWGAGTVTLTVERQYRNMLECILPHFEVVERARAAIRAAGLEPAEHPIRGGTDGARLSYRGIPCPNLGTGGFAFHGPYEHCTAEGLRKTVDILMHLVAEYTK